MRPALSLSDEYLLWNARLLEFSLIEGVDEDGRFFLSVQEFLDAEPDGFDAAKERFLRPVQSVYEDLRTHTTNPVRELYETTDAKGQPACVAFLGASVLASEAAEGNSYYQYLAEILKQPQDGSGVWGFVHESFAAAWQWLDRYLQRTQDCEIAPPEENGKKYVRWPRMHCLLRAGDVADLPYFFIDYGIKPLRGISEEALKERFQRWLTGNGKYKIAPRAQRAWRDSVRQPGIVRQIARVLSQWDGLPPVVNGGAGTARLRRTNRIFASLALEMNDGELSKLLLRVKRPENRPDFPERVPIGGSMGIEKVELTFARNRILCDRIIPPSWSGALHDGIESGVAGRVALVGKKAFAFVATEFGDYENAPALRLNQTGIVLCRTECAATLLFRLNSCTNPPPKRRDLREKLPGWTLLSGFIPVRAGFDECFGVRFSEEVLIRPLGGLRFGKSRDWMQGAPPAEIEFLGATITEALVNGQSVPVVHRLADVRGLLDAPENYLIHAGDSRYALRIVPPEIEFRPLDATYRDALFLTEDAPERYDAAMEEITAPIPTELSPDSPLETNLSQCLLLGPTPDTAPEWAFGGVDGVISVVALTENPVAPPLHALHSSPTADLWARRVLSLVPVRIGLYTTTAMPPSPDVSRRIAETWEAYRRKAQILRQAAQNRRRTIIGSRKEEEFW